MFLIDKFENNEEFPIIDKDLIKHIIITITTKKDNRGLKVNESSNAILKELKEFYLQKYKKCLVEDDIIESSKLNYILAYECIDIVYLSSIILNVVQRPSDNLFQ